MSIAGLDVEALKARGRALRVRRMRARVGRALYHQPFSLPAWAPALAVVADASSPFQRMADAVATEPCRVWSLLDLHDVGRGDWATSRLCLERLVREGLLERHAPDGWRAADRPAWWPVRVPR